MIPTRLVRLLAIGALSLTVARAQQPPPSPETDPPKPTGLIVGQVVDADTNRPIANAIVSLSSGPAVGRELVAVGLAKPPAASRILTDTQGRFVFHDLTKGIYTFNVTASRYLPGAYGQRRPSGAARPFALEDDQRVGNVTIRLWKEAALGGTVVDESGEPVVGVSVSLLRRDMTGGHARIAVMSSNRTDDRGMYRFSGRLPGDYLLAIPSALASVPLSSVAAYQQAAATAPGGNIMNTDLYKSLSTSRAPIPSTGGLQIGDALLQLNQFNSSALPPPPGPDGKLLAYPTTFYPNVTTSSRAIVVSIASGDDKSGIDIQLRPATMVGVSGTVLGLNGPEPNFGVRLVPAYVESEGLVETQFETATTATDGNGRFAFLAVPTGQYTLKASKVPRAANPFSGVTTMISTGQGGVTMFSTTEQPGGQPAPAPPPLPADPTLWAETSVSVGETAVSGVSLQLRAAPTVSGRFEFDGSAQRPIASVLQTAAITLASADGHSPICCPASRVSADGQFNTQGYVPGKYFLSVNNLSGWYLKSITAGGKDLLQAPLAIENDPITDVVVTFGDAATELGGNVTDSTGKADTIASVIIFPSDYQSWITNGMNSRLGRQARPSETGAFNFIALIPGEYLIAAASDDALANWQDPAIIRALAGIAIRVTVAPGEKKKQDVKTGQIK